MAEESNPVGRPTIMTPEVVIKLEQAFSIGADVSAACFYANISRQTYYEFINKNPEYADRFEMLREKPVLQAYQTVMSKMNETDTAKWYLERKRKMEFSTRSEIIDPRNSYIDEAVNNISKLLGYGPNTPDNTATVQGEQQAIDNTAEISGSVQSDNEETTPEK